MDTSPLNVADREEDDSVAQQGGGHGVFWPFGTMPKLPEYLKERSKVLGFVDMVLRGAAQVCFMNNPVTGLLVIIALMINNWVTATFGLISLVASTLTGCALKGYDACTSGLFGFNGILVGIAISAFVEHKYLHSPAHIAMVVVTCIVFGIMASVVTITVGKFLGGHGLPGLTLPFNICTLWVLAGTLSYAHWEMSSALTPRIMKQGNITTCLRADSDGDCLENQFLGLAIASLQGVCEIYLAGNMISSVIMLVGFAICSPLASLLLWAGSAIGVLVGWVVGLDGNFLYTGLSGFNPALTAAGIGAGIFGALTPRTVIWGLLGAVVTPLLQSALASFFSPAGMPTFTVPFCIVTLFLLGADVAPKELQIAPSSSSEEA